MRSSRRSTLLRVRSAAVAVRFWARTATASRFVGGLADVSEVGSAGEKKALGLLLLRAQAAVLESVDRSPVVLADDLDAELDLGRLMSVWKALGRSRQLIATSNRSEVSEVLAADFEWAVSAGRLNRAEGS